MFIPDFPSPEKPINLSFKKIQIPAISRTVIIKITAELLQELLEIIYKLNRGESLNDKEKKSIIEYESILQYETQNQYK